MPGGVENAGSVNHSSAPNVREKTLEQLNVFELTGLMVDAADGAGKAGVNIDDLVAPLKALALKGDADALQCLAQLALRGSANGKPADADPAGAAARTVLADVYTSEEVSPGVRKDIENDALAYFEKLRDNLEDASPHLIQPLYLAAVACEPAYGLTSDISKAIHTKLNQGLAVSHSTGNSASARLAKAVVVTGNRETEMSEVEAANASRGSLDELHASGLALHARTLDFPVGEKRTSAALASFRRNIEQNMPLEQGKAVPVTFHIDGHFCSGFLCRNEHNERCLLLLDTNPSEDRAYPRREDGFDRVIRMKKSMQDSLPNACAPLGMLMLDEVQKSLGNSKTANAETLRSEINSFKDKLQQNPEWASAAVNMQRIHALEALAAFP